MSLMRLTDGVERGDCMTFAILAGAFAGWCIELPYPLPGKFVLASVMCGACAGAAFGATLD